MRKEFAIACAVPMLWGLATTANTAADSFDLTPIMAAVEMRNETETRPLTLVAVDAPVAGPEAETARVDADALAAAVDLPEVFFAYGQADLTPGAVRKLRAVVAALDEGQGLEIVGHTDHVGSDEFNLQLGQERADAVRDWLVAEGGLGADGLTSLSLGERAPVVANVDAGGRDNPYGRIKNRRVAFRVVSLVAENSGAQEDVMAMDGTAQQATTRIVR